MSLKSVCDEGIEHPGICHQALRLLVVPNQRQSSLQNRPIVYVSDLGREVVALDSVGVVQVVQRVVDGEAEARAPGNEALMNVGRNADFRDLLEDVGADREKADQSGAGPSTQHHLQAALEGKNLRVEARAGDDVRQQVLDVVQDAGLSQRVGQVEDLLLEKKLFFVIEHLRSMLTHAVSPAV